MQQISIIIIETIKFTEIPGKHEEYQISQITN